SCTRRPWHQRMLPEANAAASSGMMKSGLRASAATVVLAVATALSKLVPPSGEGRSHPARWPPAAGVKAPPDVKYRLPQIAFASFVWLKTPELPPTLDRAAAPLANALSSVVRRLNGVAMNPLVPAASKKLVGIGFSYEVRVAWSTNSRSSALEL